MTDGPVEPRFRVLAVCHANICRSPLMEAMICQSAQTRGLDWHVSSAGTKARGHEAMHPYARRLLVRRGIDPPSWTSRRVERELLTDTDLILTATEAIRDQVVALHPPALSRTFALMSFASLVTSAVWSDAEGPFGPWLLDEAQRARGRQQPLPPELRDIADPMGRSRRWFSRCEQTIDSALTRIFAPLATPAGR